jgi:hypothetical protein
MNSWNPLTGLTLSAALSLTALALVAALAACGSPSDVTSAVTAGEAATRPNADHAAVAAGRPIERDLPRPVRARQAMVSISPFGAVAPPPAEAVPIDPGARSRAGLYATPAQAEVIARELDGDVAWVTLTCCDATALDLARGLVYGQMAAQDLPGDAPVFVSGDDPRAAARLADLLSDEGLTRVYLITR